MTSLPAFVLWFLHVVLGMSIPPETHTQTLMAPISGAPALQQTDDKPISNGF
ncbi:MAG TPA: hypothetical protein PL002_03435 [Flavobacteriales bacterium]|nr:hypothetical protein [Flavobacteriales bacterium]